MEYPVETKEVQLEYPVTVAGKEYKALTMRRPKVRDQLIADKQNKDPADKEIHLLSLLAGVETAVIQELDMTDYGEVQKAYKGFTKKNSKSETSNEQ
ncbi:phage tail assembly protein [Vibrio crassostreae]|uniref:phage tail assembly protein n=1 Tax=Vibrio crassostreae TaxID=246167 RepID=UPI0010479F28|nr:phage tail assembly protein [Vibrio crassostreae]TCN02947.1 tail assembly chaperone E/41/14-like protein [Vibrio crassostreae]